MPIKVELKSFYVEGNKLHLTLEFPDEVVVVGSGQAVAVPSKVGRQDILRCRDISQVFYILRSAGDTEGASKVKAFQVSENVVGRRLTPRKAADLLFPVKKVKKGLVSSDPVRISGRVYGDILAWYSRFEGVGVDESNYTRMVDAKIHSRYTSLSLFCTSGTDEELEAEFAKVNDV